MMAAGEPGDRKEVGLGLGLGGRGGGGSRPTARPNSPFPRPSGHAYAEDPRYAERSGNGERSDHYQARSAGQDDGGRAGSGAPRSARHGRNSVGSLRSDPRSAAAPAARSHHPSASGSGSGRRREEEVSLASSERGTTSPIALSRTNPPPLRARRPRFSLQDPRAVRAGSDAHYRQDGDRVRTRDGGKHGVRIIFLRPPWHR